MNDQSITCVMPAKNAERTIGIAVRSTLAALPSNGLLLVRDDGSTDGTVHVLRKIRDRRLVVIEGDSSGVAAGLNEMINHASSALIARMDADDVCARWRFTAQLQSIRRNDFVFTPWISWLSRSPIVKAKNLTAIGSGSSPLQLLVDNPFLHPSMLARRNAILDLSGYRNVASEDYDLWLRAAALDYRLVLEGPPAVLYRRHRNQLTQAATWKSAQHADSRIYEAWATLAKRELNFVPSWFNWRRAGFPATSVPASFAEDLSRMRAVASNSDAPGRLKLLRRLNWMERRAHILP